MCGLIGHPSRNMENTGVEHDLNYADQAQEVSGEMNFSMRPIDCSCDIFSEECGCFLALSVEST